MATVLVIGGGGREHAIAWKLAESEKVSSVHVAPGNGGTKSGKLSNVALKLEQPHFEGVIRYCKEQNVSLVAVGPEQPLVDGIADSLRAEGIKVFGCSKASAQIEGSKAFSKDFFSKYNIPTAQYKSFKGAEEAEAAMEYVKTCGFPVVVKASGLCAGKGVIMPENQEEALEAVREMLLQGKFGAAGTEIVIEELMEGPECSVFGLCDGVNVVAMVPAQDHKRALDGDQGLNTGGMGAYAPAPVCTPELQKRILEELLKPTMEGFQKEGMPYQGLLYAGVMLTKDGPKLLEYNCRFGDPETEVVLPLLKSDLFDVMHACAEVGGLASCDVEFYPKSAVTVVMASDGYPGSYKTGFPISGLPDTSNEEPSSKKQKGANETIVFHAGTKADGSAIVSSGGRVLAVTAVSDTLKEAISSSYAAVGSISWENAFYRKDIAAKASVTV